MFTVFVPYVCKQVWCEHLNRLRRTRIFFVCLSDLQRCVLLGYKSYFFFDKPKLINGK